MNRFLIVVAVSAFAILVAASGAWATNVTIPDTISNTSTNHNPDPSGVGLEDNEVERDDATNTNMVTGQAWDLEAFLWDVTKDGSGAITSRTLTMIGGWDFKDGGPSGYTQWKSGDVFLAMTEPKYGATILAMNPLPKRYSDAACTIESLTGKYVKEQFGYTKVLNMNWLGASLNSDGSSWSVPYRAEDLVVNTTVELAVYPGTTYNSGSNPYRVNADPTSYDRTATFTEYTGANGGGQFAGTTHYSVAFNFFDGDWIGPAADDLWMHFTMGCGNDDLMGHIPDTSVPEPISMVMLGCLGAGMLGARKARQLRKAAK